MVGVVGEAEADKDVGEVDGEEEVLYDGLGVVEGLCFIGLFFVCFVFEGGAGKVYVEEKREVKGVRRRIKRERERKKNA